MTVIKPTKPSLNFNAISLITACHTEQRPYAIGGDAMGYYYSADAWVLAEFEKAADIQV